MSEHDDRGQQGPLVSPEERRRIEEDIKWRERFRQEFGDPEEESPDGRCRETTLPTFT